MYNAGLSWDFCLYLSMYANLVAINAERGFRMGPIFTFGAQYLTKQHCYSHNAIEIEAQAAAAICSGPLSI